MGETQTRAWGAIGSFRYRDREDKQTRDMGERWAEGDTEPTQPSQTQPPGPHPFPLCDCTVASVTGPWATSGAARVLEFKATKIHQVS